MDIERLKEDIESVESDLEYGEYQDQGKVAVNVEGLRSVINFANEAIARQSVKSEEVAEAIEDLTTLSKMWKEIGQPTKEIDLAIAALQAYQPWIPVSDRIPTESELRNGMVLAWSTELCEWQVENWRYVEDRLDDYTHWKPLPEPRKENEYEN